jgi:hypothetical protein
MSPISTIPVFWIDVEAMPCAVSRDVALGVRAKRKEEALMDFLPNLRIRIHR